MDEDDVAEPPLFTGFQARSSDFEPLIIHHESPQTFAIKGVAGFLFLQKNKIALSTVTLIYHYYHFESGGQKNGKG